MCASREDRACTSLAPAWVNCLYYGINSQSRVPVEQSALAMAVNKETTEMFELLAEFIKDPDELNFLQLARLLQHEEASTASDRFKDLLKSFQKVKSRFGKRIQPFPGKDQGKAWYPGQL